MHDTHTVRSLIQTLTRALLHSLPSRAPADQGTGNREQGSMDQGMNHSPTTPTPLNAGVSKSTLAGWRTNIRDTHRPCRQTVHELTRRIQQLDSELAEAKTANRPGDRHTHDWATWSIGDDMPAIRYCRRCDTRHAVDHPPNGLDPSRQPPPDNPSTAQETWHRCRECGTTIRREQLTEDEHEHGLCLRCLYTPRHR